MRTAAGQAAAAIAPKFGRKNGVWVPDSSRPGGGFYVRKPELTLQLVLASVALLEK